MSGLRRTPKHVDLATFFRDQVNDSEMKKAENTNKNPELETVELSGEPHRNDSPTTFVYVELARAGAGEAPTLPTTPGL